MTIDFKVQMISTDLIMPHPQNPRMIMRDDVIDSLATAMAGGFDPAHAILVRPFEAGFQIISGHHRTLAAQKAGITELPCWVREMNDEEAYMALATSNNQGELSSLEIGFHALHCVGLSLGGRGQKGGISAYAQSLGKAQNTISELVSAAKVAQKVSLKRWLLVDKTKHLASLHTLPEDCWQHCTGWVLDTDATVAQTKAMVKTIKSLVESVPAWWPADLAKLTQTALSSPNEAGRRESVYKEAAAIDEKLSTVTLYRHEKTDEVVDQEGRQFFKAIPVSFEYDQKQAFRTSLLGLSTMPTGADIRRIQTEILNHTANHSDQSVRLLPVLTEAEQAIEDQKREEAIEAEKRNMIAAKIFQGDCLEALERYQGEKIKLLLSDPPYGMDFQSNRRVVTQKTEKIASDNSYQDAMKLTADMLAAAAPHLDENAHVILFCNDEGAFHLRRVVEDAGLTFKRLLTWVKPNHTSGDLEGAFAPRKELAIHAVKGRPLVSPRRDDVFIQDRTEKETDHPTEKPLSLLKAWIECTTTEGDTVVDPFGGTGATFVAAASLGRDVYGSELDPHYHQQAVTRLLEVA